MPKSSSPLGIKPRGRGERVTNTADDLWCQTKDAFPQQDGQWAYSCPVFVQGFAQSCAHLRFNNRSLMKISTRVAFCWLMLLLIPAAQAEQLQALPS